MNKLVFKIPYTQDEVIPIEAYPQLHRDYWNFIADHELDYKPEIHYSLATDNSPGNEVHIYAKCFACDYKQLTLAKTCPIRHFRQADIGYCDCSNEDSLYVQWSEASDTIQRSVIARKIANLALEMLPINFDDLIRRLRYLSIHLPDAKVITPFDINLQKRLYRYMATIMQYLDELEIVKTCNCCFYRDYETYEEPCESCVTCSNWKARKK